MKAERKTKHIDIRVTPAEYEQLLRKAEGNLSSFCRSLLFQNLNAKSPEADYKAIVYQIRKIGININQIAARTNAGISFIDDGQVLLRELKKIHEILEVLEEQEWRLQNSDI